MKVTTSTVSVSMALLAPQVLAVPAATSTSDTCTATASPSAVASICGYEPPVDCPETCYASSGSSNCLDICANIAEACSYVVFNPHNADDSPDGDGTCWVYTDGTYNATATSTCTGSPYQFVYNNPCPTSTTVPTTTAACTATATASPSAVASICGYEPPVDCWDDCYASSGASNCLDICANIAEACSYVVFNPHNADDSPYDDGTCWVYPNGTYEAASATSCTGSPTQFVYTNPCPQSASSSVVATTTTTTTSAACTATASPSVVASICGYEPPVDCSETCYASSGSSNCLDICANIAEACTYVVFNPHNTDDSPNGDGTCWVYTDGTYSAAAASTCTGSPTQFVYNNPCPTSA